mmetsp:Transcript_47766/g.123304  ORF Transcript_47766/g.123304 Transcript_47766/m.123304 type:complete len:93 (-) Transcript_47766:22-300(-)
MGQLTMVALVLNKGGPSRNWKHVTATAKTITRGMRRTACNMPQQPEAVAGVSAGTDDVAMTACDDGEKFTRLGRNPIGHPHALPRITAWIQT